MPEYTKDEAMAFIETLRLTVSGKTGFKWLAGRLSELTAYIESIARENEHMKAYLASVGARDDYESYLAAHQDPPARA